MTWIVLRDGKKLKEFNSYRKAFEWLKAYQPFSVEWACKEDGYKVEEVKA